MNRGYIISISYSNRRFVTAATLPVRQMRWTYLVKLALHEHVGCIAEQITRSSLQDTTIECQIYTQIVRLCAHQKSLG